MRNTFLQLFFVLICTICFAQYPPVQWINKFTSVAPTGAPIADVDEVVLDSQGNIYVVGYFEDTLYHDPFSTSVKLLATQPGKPTVYFAKYTPAGALVMAKAVGTGYGLDIALDKWNNIYITGYSPAATNSDFDPGPATAYHTSGTQFMFMCKYDNNGNYLNSRFFSGNGVKGLGIAADSLANIYLSGCVQAAVDFDPGAGTLLLMRHTTLVNRDGFYASYDSSMNLRWAKVDVLTRDCEDIAVQNATGRILVASAALRLVNQNGATTDSLINSAGGTNGVAFDDAGNIYCSGFFSDANINFNWNGSNTLSTTGPNDDWGFLVKYNSSRVFQWAQKYKVNYDVRYNKVSVLSNTVLLAYFESDGIQPHRGFLKVNPANGLTIGKPCDFATHVGAQSVSGALYSSVDNSLIFTGNAGGGNYVHTFDINPDTAVAAVQNVSALGYWGFAIKYANCTTAPTQPGSIAGNTALCNTANQTYTIAPVAGATSYTWTLPNGWTGTSTSNSITVQPVANGGSISVAAQNFCGSSSASSLAVTYTPQVSVTINASANSVCAGTAVTLTATGASGYSWNNGVSNGIAFTPTTSATYTVTASAGSCIDVDSVTVVVKQPTTSTVNAAVCNGQSYLFNGTLLTAAGTYYDTLVNHVGCDSIITLTLSVKQPTTLSLSASICQGQSYAFNGQNLSASGMYKDTLVNTAGCDSILTLTLIVNMPTSASVSAAICQGQVYSFNGQNLSLTGTYKDTLVNNSGCDSIVTLTLTVKQNTSSSIAASICPGESYFFGGSVYNNPGLYYDTLSNAVGCDSIIILTLNQLLASASTVSASICQGQSYSFNGANYTSVGVYRDTLVNAVGCDSIVTLNLIVEPVKQSTIQAVICAGGTYNFNGQQLTQSGTYVDTLAANTGCDSLVTLTLTVTNILYNAIADAICMKDTFVFNGNNLTQPGVYYDTLQSANGCDSVVTLTLAVNPLPQPTVTLTNSLLQTESFSNYQWQLNGNSISGANNQQHTPAENGTYLVVVTDSNGCQNSSETIAVTNVGIESILANVIKMYPNPANNTLTVEAPKDGILMIITSAQGQVVHTSNLVGGKVTYNIAELPTGVLNVQFKSANNTLTTRLIKLN
jgi:hypothetical protein